MMGQTFAEKVLALKSGVADVEPGKIVTVRPDHLLSHDNTAAIIAKIKPELEEHGVCSRDLHCVILDHVVPAASEKDAANHKAIREYVTQQRVNNFFDMGEGICHQVMCEQGLALPGSLIVGSDSHTCMYGALGVFSTGIDRTEAAALLLTGETWLKTPPTIKIDLQGQLQPMVLARDLILCIIGEVGAGGATYSAVEFHGDGAGCLSINERMTIANMGVEMGAKIAVFEVDAKTEQYLKEAGVSPDKYEPQWADADAAYSRVLQFDLASIPPVVALPHKVDNVVPISEVEGTPINQFLLGTCTNGRAADFEIAASILKGKRIATGCRLLLLPASREVLRRTLASGAMQTLIEAGGIMLPPGCGPCLGAHQGALAPGERCLSTSPRNFKGRMGCKEAEVYLGSPASVAASAIYGKISDPRKEV
jgi:3-isopropylmalate/(R)-2-methylmalate dehydratase large subunit